MILQFMISLIFATSIQAKATPYADCDKSYGKTLDSCGPKGSTITTEACSNNIDDCKKKCGAVNDAVARRHVMNCRDNYRKASSDEQKSVQKSVENVNKEFSDEDETNKANKGTGAGMFNGMTGTLSTYDNGKTGKIEIKEFKGGISFPINVKPAPMVSPPASQ